MITNDHARRVGHVVFVMKGPLAKCPPAQAYTNLLRDKGFEVTFLHTPTAPETVTALRARGVKMVEVGREMAEGKLGKVVNRLQFAVSARAAIRETMTGRSLLWVIGGDTVSALHESLVTMRGFVLSLLELHDGSFYYQRALANVAPRASVVTACEDTRAALMKMWWKLDELPVVIPNKPYGSLPQRNCKPSSTAASRGVEEISGRKALLYQGLLTPERDLRPIAAAVRNVEEIDFVVMGDDPRSTVDELRELNERVIHIPYIRPPWHLEVTSHAYIGVASYVQDSLNSMFCAPNKVYEYGAYGIPMLCNRAPGLRMGVGEAGAAECVDDRSAESIRAGLEKIVADYDSYSAAARRFYDSCDTGAQLAEVLDRAAFNRVG